MNRRENVSRFSIYFDKETDLDIDLLELQLHSLYKQQNIKLDEVSYYNDLQNCNFRATTLDIAKKSFVKAIVHTLESQSITLKDIDYSTIDMYSSYNLEIIYDKDFIARNQRKEIREGVNNLTGEKINILQRVYRLPLAIIAYEPRNYLVNKQKLSKSTAYRKMYDDIMTWEKDIIERLVEQLRSEYVPKKG